MDIGQPAEVSSCARNMLAAAAMANPLANVRPQISLILPAYNEQETIAQAILEAEEALAALTSDYEILIVDDGSTDDTFDIAQRESHARPQVRVLRQPSNIGYGAALRRGFAAARFPLIAFTDADCQFQLRELDRLILLSKDYDVVCGYRIVRHEGWRRALTSSVYNLLAKALFGIAVRDCDCALKLFRKDFLETTPIESDGFFVNAELLAKARWQERSVVEVGVTHRRRAGGASKISLRQVYPVATAMLRFWWSSKFAPAPATAPLLEVRWKRRVEFGFVFVLAVFAMSLLFGRLGYPLIEPDETRYAQIAAEMVESGDWITPTLVGRPYLDKPPLLYWATALCYQWLGVDEVAARLPGAISALLTLLVTYALGRRLVGSRAACFGAAALLMCGGFVLSGRFILMDGPLTLFVTIALLAGYLACCGTLVHCGWLIVAAVACALGILTKGPIAIVICLPPVLAMRWLSIGRPRLLPRHWGILVVGVALVTVPWFVAISLANVDFVSHFLWRHHVVRFVRTFHHQEPWWYYLPVVLVGTFPASLLLPSLIRFLFRKQRGTDVPRHAPELGFLLLSVVWTVLFFSLSSCKLPTYVLPAFPPLCLLIGSMLDKVALPGSAGALTTGFHWLPQRMAFSVLAVAMVAVIAEVILFAESETGWVLNCCLLMGGSLLLVVVWQAAPRRGQFAWACSAVMAMAVMAFVFFDFLPKLSLERSIHARAAELQWQRGQVPVIYFDRQSYAATFHVDRRTLHCFEAEEIIGVGEFLQEHRNVVVVTMPESAETLIKSFGGDIELSVADERGHVYLSRTKASSDNRVGIARKPKIR